jgi:hypothetical protein
MGGQYVPEAAHKPMNNSWGTHMGNGHPSDQEAQHAARAAGEWGYGSNSETMLHNIDMELWFKL